MSSRFFAATALAAMIAGAAEAAPQTLIAELKNSTGQTVGAVTLTEAPKGVVMRIEAKGLSPGWHGLHFHEKGDCSKSDFTSAGAHVHGAGTAVHGLLNPSGNETGDLPNIHAGTDGEASAEVFTTAGTRGSPTATIHSRHRRSGRWSRSSGPAPRPARRSASAARWRAARWRPSPWWPWALSGSQCRRPAWGQ
jgi:Cu-Zn family superoxide dismutase